MELFRYDYQAPHANTERDAACADPAPFEEYAPALALHSQLPTEADIVAPSVRLACLRNL